MRKLYKNLAAICGAGLIGLGLYDFKNCNPAYKNPHAWGVIQILSMKENIKISEEEFMEHRKNDSRYDKIFCSDPKTKELIDKLDEPYQTKYKTLVDLNKCLNKELENMTLSNKEWRSYTQWEAQTIRENKTNTKNGILALLSGIAIIGLSRKKD